MAYIGQDIEGGVLEKQTLAFDSVTTTFELDYYSAENGLVVSVGGIIQEPGVAFTVNGKNIVFALAPTQATFVVFIERELHLTTIKALDYVEYQRGTGNATTTPVTLNNSVTNPEEIMVSLNGLTQIPTTDYTVSGTTLTFDEAPVAGTEIFILFLRLETSSGVLPSGYTLTNSKIVSLDAGKLTGSLPNSFTSDVTPQWHALNSVGMHWMNLENKTKINFVQSYYDHFEDDTGWVAYNGVAGVPAMSDASSSARTVTASGNAAASTTEKKIGTHSIAFDGTGDYLQVNNLFDLDDFTIELWMYNTESNSNAHIIGNCNHTTGGGGGWGLYCNGSGIIKFNSYGNSWHTGNVSTGFSTSTWHHVAVTRSGNAVKMFLDGVQKYSGTPSSATLGGGTNLGIGSDNGVTSSMDFVGYMDEIRISNTARYTSAFTPSTTAFTSDANTLLLIHGEAQVAVPNTGSENVGRDTTGEYVSTNVAGSATDWPYTNFADQVFSVSSGAFPDINSYNNSGTTHTIAKNSNNTYLAWTDSPTNWTHSMMVDYKAAYTWSGIKIGFHNNYAMVKTWRLEYSDDGTNWTIMDQTGSTSASLTGYNLAIDNNVSITTDATGVITNVTNGGNHHKHGAHITFGTPVTARHLKISVGSHVANSDSAAALDFFIPLYAPTSTNTVGTLVSTATTADATVSEASGIMMYADGTDNASTIGTDLKVHFSSDDGANWTEAASYDNPITFDGTTKLLTLPKTTLTGGTGTAVKMKAEFANQQGASAIGNTANVITPHGDVKHSTALVDSGKIGKSCMKFTGNGGSSPTSHLSIPHSDDFDFPNDFTVEFWFNTVASDHSGNGGTMLSRHHAGLTTTQIGFRDSSNGQLMAQAHNVNQLFGPTGLHDGNWHHLAWVRSGTGSNNIKIYVDGTQQHQYTSTNPWFRTDASSPIYIGSYGNSEYFGGKIDEVRISDNARYTSNFTPSTTAFTSDSNTVVLVHSDTAHGSTTFTDSSSNGYTITPTAVSHFNAAPPVGGTAIEFDGSSFLSIPDHADWEFGTNDFTVETWYKASTVNSGGGILGNATGGGWADIGLHFGTDSGGRFQCYVGHNGGTGAYFASSGSSDLDSTKNICDDVWHHLAFVRYGDSIYGYVDGVLEAKDTHAGLNQTNVNTGWFFGKQQTSGGGSNCLPAGSFLDEIRISNVARYTANFTPSKTKFVKDNQTLLLIHSDDANNSVTFTSDEVKSNIIAPIGDVTHSNYVAKFGNSGINLTSAAGQGGSEYLTVPHSDDWRPNNNGVLTIECWIKPTASSQPMAYNNTILSYYDPDGWMIEMNQDRTLRFRCPKSAGFATWHLLDSAAPLPLNQWSHLAVVMDRVNDIDYLYLNGVLETSGANNFDHAVTSDPLIVGRYTPTNDSGMVGYLDEIRISNVARYTGATYTEPTAAFTSDANTLLLIHSDEADGSTTFTDSSSHARTITRVGVSHEGTQKKIGTSSIYFDGNGDYVSIPDNDLWTLGTDWTVEFWVRFNVLQKQSLMGVFSNAATSGLQWMIHMEANNTIEATCCNASTTFGYCVSGGLSANTWYHITYQRDSTNQFCLYIDGTPVYTRSHTHTMQNLSLPLEMGRNTYAGLNSLNGYLDEVRISNVARYTYNTAFTPSTSAFTPDGNTVLLLHGDGTGNLFTDDSYTAGKQTQLHGWAVNY
tara:strand:+ start:17806 stop:22839 length:5034 start_codon:yes stop_codon:yes gene_type:complete